MEGEAINCLSFNQDCSCLAVGTDKGYKIFTCDPFKKCCERTDGGARVVQMLYCTSLFAVVGSGQQPAQSTRRLQLFNTSEQKSICELNFTDQILNVQMSKKRLLVVLEKRVHVFDIATMRPMQAMDTPSNPRGLVGLSMDEDLTGGLAYIAHPWSTENNSGDVVLLEANTLARRAVIRAHNGPLAALAISSDGRRLATASAKGTVIRVFDLPGARNADAPSLSFTLRRGAQAATIYSLALNADATFLAASSDTGTIHIWDLTKDGKGGDRNVGSFSDRVTNIWDTKRDFAHVKMKNEGASVRNVCVINGRFLLVATFDGMLYRYSFEQPGACQFKSEHKLLDSHGATQL